MILSATGYAAVYVQKIVQPDGTETEHRWQEPLVFWKIEGEEIVGYILDAQGKVVRADEFDAFWGYDRDEQAHGATVASPPGWWAVMRLDDDPTRAWWEPIIAWSISQDGIFVQAILAPDESGLSEPVMANKYNRFVYDPMRLSCGEGPWPFDDDDEDDDGQVV